MAGGTATGPATGPAFAEDIARIQQTVLDFVARDQGRWDELLDQFHADGRIQVSWFRGPFTQFVQASRAMAARSTAAGKHCMGTPRVRVAHDRAVADTDVVIMLRFPLAGQEVDMASHARFHDWFERRDGVWRVVRRVCIYERDRLDPVGDPAGFAPVRASLDLAAQPPPYRHLAGALKALGAPVLAGQVCAGTEAEAGIFESDRGWLDTGRLEGAMAIALDSD